MAKLVQYSVITVRVLVPETESEESRTDRQFDDLMVRVEAAAQSFAPAGWRVLVDDDPQYE